MKNWNVTNCLGISPTHRTQYCKDGSSSLHGRKYASYMYIYDAYIYPMHACGCYGAIFCCLTRQDNTWTFFYSSPPISEGAGSFGNDGGNYDESSSGMKR